MHLTPLSFFTAWSVLALALASPNVDIDNAVIGQSEFRMGVILPRQQQQQTRTNLQTFSGALGGAGAPAISNSGDSERPFEVDGDTFRDFETAASRACDNQKNTCANMANNGSGASFKVGDCDQQNGESRPQPPFSPKCFTMKRPEEADDLVFVSLLHRTMQELGVFG